jgi:hypothetical protein
MSSNDLVVSTAAGDNAVAQKEAVLRSLAKIEAALKDAKSMNDVIKVRDAAIAIETFARQKRLAADIVVNAHALVVDASVHMGAQFNAEAAKVKLLGKCHPSVIPVSVLAKEFDLTTREVVSARRLHVLQGRDNEAFLDYRTGRSPLRNLGRDTRASIVTQDRRPSITFDYKKNLLKFVVHMKDLERRWRTMVDLVTSGGENAAPCGRGLKRVCDNLTNHMKTVNHAVTETINSAYVETYQEYEERKKRDACTSVKRSQANLPEWSPRKIRAKRMKKQRVARQKACG